MLSGSSLCISDHFPSPTSGKLRIVNQCITRIKDTDNVDTDACDDWQPHTKLVAIADHSVESRKEQASSRFAVAQHASLRRKSRTLSSHAASRSFCLIEGYLGGGCCDLRLHVNRKTIPRFKPGSVMTCSIDFDSFTKNGCTTKDAEHVETSFRGTLDTTNSHNIGLSFKYKKQCKDTVLKVVYAKHPTDASHEWPDTTYARSFLPGADPKHYILHIYEHALKPENRSSIGNILSHELAHIMGMRHWFPHEGELSCPSVEYPSGVDHSRSVMGPCDDLNDLAELYFHTEDIKWLKKFYAKKAGEIIKGYRIVDVPLDSIADVPLGGTSMFHWIALLIFLGIALSMFPWRRQLLELWPSDKLKDLLVGIISLAL